ncbi:phosphoenolpyruvate--protein phosphotransferase [Magnetovibrio blakemorei]|uniref:phosphoenolpyruvate--protein phosphotransferase n=2 Tax=Magnetovibrio blakemorei TaxID=28181 RepID=A0A1E5Q6T8_9PROT|nr:phosphoenolpyruvate--protein phosphotransferase [Magnetovibrio blakemorei]
MNPASISTAPRRLLARVRDVMAGEGSAQSRLDKITAIIAADLVTEVCSVYVRRAGDVLELFSTQGLSPKAVHVTRLRFGEGLIGEIAARAAPLALSDAQAHPNFVFRPETGEDEFHSLMGVPVLRAGRVVGVAAVQNKTERQYTDEEIETLQTVAMVLAEMVAGGELISRHELMPTDGIALKPLRLEGTCFSIGLGIGQAVLHEPSFDIGDLVAEDPEQEMVRLHEAFTAMLGQLDTILSQSPLTAGEGGEHEDVLEAFRMVAEDAGWLRRTEEAVTSGLTAEAAVLKVKNEMRARLGASSDPYLRERMHDMEDLGNRLLKQLLGTITVDKDDLPEHVILVARNMGPAELLEYDHTRLRGLVLEEGSATSHVAIVARALDIPVMGHVREVLSKIDNGESIIVDGQHSQVLVRPGEDVQQAFHETRKALEQIKAQYAQLKDLPAKTLDGIEVSLSINAGLLFDFDQIETTGANGVGLYRTEVPFMVRAEFPDVPAQRTLYEKVLDRANGKPVVFRTIDVGGDKVLPYWGELDEENPAMGWRAIRICLDRPAILRQQLRALIQAAQGRDIHVMFPMIAEVEEFDAAKKLLQRELDREKERGGILPEHVYTGVMLEVPALALQLDKLLKRVDFVSVGSNDLMQFLYATDRGNAHVSERYDILSPFALGFLKSVRDRCDQANVPVSVCGAAAGNPLEAMALVGIGFRRLSMPPPALGPVKEMIRSMSERQVAQFVHSVLEIPRVSIRPRLKAFAKDHGIKI